MLVYAAPHIFYDDHTHTLVSGPLLTSVNLYLQHYVTSLISFDMAKCVLAAVYLGYMALIFK